MSLENIVLTSSDFKT